MRAEISRLNLGRFRDTARVLCNHVFGFSLNRSMPLHICVFSLAASYFSGLSLKSERLAGIVRWNADSGRMKLGYSLRHCCRTLACAVRRHACMRQAGRLTRIHQNPPGLTRVPLADSGGIVVGSSWGPGGVCQGSPGSLAVFDGSWWILVDPGGSARILPGSTRVPGGSWRVLVGSWRTHQDVGFL